MLHMRSITKTFPGVVANDAISLDVRAGEVHALLGENGAGKSTLMKVLYGLQQPDAGTIELAGRPLQISSPRAAVEHGIGMVHQHFMLVENLTGVENAVLGIHRGSPVLDLGVAAARLRELSTEYQLDVEPEALVEDMAVGAKQRLEILKLLFRDVRVLVLDEPTAVLAPAEVEQLFRMVRTLVGEGRSVIFISHKLDEVKALSDRVTVLRDGRVVATCDTANATAADLAEMMVGRAVTIARRTLPPTAHDAEPVLVLDGVTCVDDRGVQALRGVSLRVRTGEIVGIAGVDGNGQRELTECIAGLRPVDGGRITIAGRAVEAPTRDLGLLGFIPEDRQRTGLVLELSIAENLILKTFDKPPFLQRGVIRWREVWRHGREAMAALRMRRSDPTLAMAALSGGNQQRVMVGRELGGDPSLVVASQPTRGLDIGAVEDVHDMLIAQRHRGAAVLFVSTELNEVLAISDRVVVLHKGEIMGEVSPDDRGHHAVGEMMLGHRPVGPRPVDPA
jgi:simple sugar transport system ATP-binding protein